MKKMVKIALLGVLVMALVSCGRERLTPIYQPVTVNQLRQDEPIRFSYQIDDAQIDEYAKKTGKFPIFGKLFQAIAVVLANTSISNSGGHDVDLPATDVDLSSLSVVDYSVIEAVNLDNLLVNIKGATDRDSLDFISKLEIYVKLDNPVEDLEVDQNGFSKIIFFDRATDTVSCDGQCLKLNVVHIDWKRLLQTNKLVHIQPKLVINSVPKRSMKLAGSIDFSIKFNLGF